MRLLSLIVVLTACQSGPAAPVPPAPVATLPPTIAMPVFQWLPGERLVASVEMLRAETLSVKGPLGSKKKAASKDTIVENRQTLAGHLNVRVLKTTPSDRVRLAVQLAHVSARVNGEDDPDLVRLYETPFLVEFAPDGRILALIFPDGTPQEDAGMLGELLQALEVILPPAPPDAGLSGRDPHDWRIEQENSFGRYIATYHFDPATGSIAKRNAGYPAALNPVDAEGKDQVLMITSEASAVPSLRSSWLESFDSSESLQVRQQDNGLLASKTRIILKRLASLPDAALTIMQSRDDAIEAFLHRAGIAPTASYSERRRLSGKKIAFERKKITLELLVATLTRASSLKDMAGPRNDLRDYLLIHPDDVARLPALIKRTGTKSQAAGGMLHALEVIATPKAQEAIRIIFADTALPTKTRIDAVLSAGTVPAPTEVLLDALWDAATQSPDNIEFANAALLGFGLAAGKHPQVKERWLKRLETRLEDAEKNGDVAATIITITALGNTGSSAIRDAVRTYLSDKLGSLRLAAVDALGRTGDTECVTLAKTAFAKETDPEVRRKMVQILSAVFGKQKLLKPRDRL